MDDLLLCSICGHHHLSWVTCEQATICNSTVGSTDGQQIVMPFAKLSPEELAVIEINSKIQRLIEVKSQIDKTKPLYDEQDKLTVELQKLGFQEKELIDGGKAVLIDNFAEKNTVFRTAGVKRFEIDILSKEDVAKEIAKKEKEAKKREKEDKNKKG